jgi:predicted metalloprotease with PDZ domain
MKVKFLIALLFTAAIAFAQEPVRYEVSFPNYMHHEASIRASFPHFKGPATLRMSRSSPGRYATHEFGKNVYDLKAHDSATGKTLLVNQKDGDVYMIPYANGTLVVEYTLFGDHVDGTYTGIDRSHAHFNMPASFIWAVGKDASPVLVKFIVPDGSNWKVATQLKPVMDASVFYAPNLQLFMDSPTELSDFKMRSWMVKDTDGKEKTIRIALHADVTDELMDGFAEDVKKVVLEARNVYGALPDYDFGVYTFIIDLQPKNNGDGMEHRNSTCITGRAGKLTKEMLKGELEVVSHEFFHCWNVERIRPKTIEPFDFTKSNMSDALWVAEGFTQYYGDLLLVRAGLEKENEFLGALGSYLNGFTNNPGGKYRTPLQASKLAVYTDAATAIDKTNFSNIFYSYYLYGASIASILDLTLRRDFNKSLDDYMKLLWKKYGKTGVAYTVADLQATLVQLTNAGFAKQFFDDYIYGVKRNPLNELFATAGVDVINPNAGKSSVGNITVKTTDGMAEITSAVQKGSPLYEAGLENGDLIRQLDGKDVKTLTEINEILATKKPGDELMIVYRSRGVDVNTKIKLMEATGLQLKISDSPSDQQKTARDKWLGKKQAF